MKLTASFRKFVLTTHVSSSVAWSGAVAAFLALAVTGLNGSNDQIVRSAYIAMDLVTWFVIVPLCFASLLTGIVQSLGTPWGLFRHYWVLIKLLLTFLATLVLLLHTRPIGYLASVAIETSLTTASSGNLRVQLLADAGAALIVLLVTTTLGVYKPKGLTPYGYRKSFEQRVRHGVVAQAE